MWVFELRNWIVLFNVEKILHVKDVAHESQYQKRNIDPLFLHYIIVYLHHFFWPNVCGYFSMLGLVKVKDKVVPLLNSLSTTPWRRMGEWIYNPRFLHFGTSWRKRGLQNRSGWCRQMKVLDLKGLEIRFPGVKFVLSRYTDYTAALNIIRYLEPSTAFSLFL
jgi:hypothetical protein